MAEPPARKPSRARASAALVPVEAIQQRILVLRGHKVMLDADLAELYGVETRILIRNVKRNIARFPRDFMFQLTSDEFAALRSQFGISNDDSPAQSDSLRSQSALSKGRGGRRTPPYVFTEQGVAMLSGVLHSDRAVAVNIAIMRAFVQLRQVLASHVDLGRKLEELEQRMSLHDAKHDAEIAQIVDAIRQLTEPPTKPRRQIGFAPPDEPTPKARTPRKRP